MADDEQGKRKVGSGPNDPRAERVSSAGKDYFGVRGIQVLFLRALLVLVVAQFLISAVSHLINPYYFLSSIYSYQIVDPNSGVAIAVLFPFLQIVVATFLLMRVQLRVAFFLASVIFGIFSAAQGFALWKGIHISCGCFGAVQNHDVTPLSLAGVAALCVCCFTVFWISDSDHV